VWASVVVAGCILMVGLVHDGGTVLRRRAEAFDLAGAAARAGAQELDDAALTEGDVVIDDTAARRAVATYLATHDSTGLAAVTDLDVTVTVTDTVGLRFLGPVQVTVSETATARAARGAP